MTCMLNAFIILLFDFCNYSMFVLVCVIFWLFNHLDGEAKAGCFALFVFLVSRDYCVTLPHDVTGLSAVCDCVTTRVSHYI